MDTVIPTWIIFLILFFDLNTASKDFLRLEKFSIRPLKLQLLISKQYLHPVTSN